MKSKILIGITFLIGLLLFICPVVSSVMEQQYQKDAVASYSNSIEEKDSSEIEEMLKDANKYNSMLFQCNGALVDGMDSGILSEDSYNSLLNASNTGVMGSIEIPKIDVDLPIYHGTSDEVLSKGAGHYYGSSLPIGGENTRTILTGHRGLPTSKMFTRLDELIEGDLFFINVCNNTLAYKINDIQVVTPEEAEELKIEPGKDLATLITCTPYGINSHRLIITGERVSYEEGDYTSIRNELPSWREIIFTVMPFIVLFIAIILSILNRRSTKSEE